MSLAPSSWCNVCLVQAIDQVRCHATVIHRIVPHVLFISHAVKHGLRAGVCDLNGRLMRFRQDHIRILISDVICVTRNRWGAIRGGYRSQGGGQKFIQPSLVEEQCSYAVGVSHIWQPPSSEVVCNAWFAISSDSFLALLLQILVVSTKMYAVVSCEEGVAITRSETIVLSIGSREFLREKLGVYNFSRSWGVRPQQGSFKYIVVFTMSQCIAVFWSYGTWYRRSSPASEKASTCMVLDMVEAYLRVRGMVLSLDEHMWIPVILGEASLQIRRLAFGVIRVDLKKRDWVKEGQAHSCVIRSMGHQTDHAYQTRIATRTSVDRYTHRPKDVWDERERT
ncbi:uncharacterized protein EV420DRAFT_1485640 [Desarmillaria tabescens]|uniref:Uncharacterized protein n=1 Tax=Armillaria tabescens TaxID=1929756 RepID=A0AA39JF61_ARMTA|nr:uncharacterized protein EV420DRAFT_1485640 [Desarmillaria tabescens]KAK0441473.1 hypothetical protein EV420DRAFT_1485640 [Desarmillaria tabescens]